MNKYDSIALIIVGGVLVILGAGLVFFTKMLADFVDKTKSND